MNHAMSMSNARVRYSRRAVASGKGEWLEISRVCAVRRLTFADDNLTVSIQLNYVRVLIEGFISIGMR